MRRPVEAVEYPDLRRFLAQLKARNLKPRTLARKLSSLRSFFKFLQREKVIQSNPAKLLVTPKLDKPLPHFMSEEETVQFIESPKSGKINSPRDKAIFEILYSTGIRVSELVGLNVDDVDFIGNIIKVMGKGKKERMVPIGDQALNALKRISGSASRWIISLFLSTKTARVWVTAVCAILSINIFSSRPWPST